MSDAANEITAGEGLRQVYGQPAEITTKKILDRLDDHCRRFIALSPFLTIVPELCF